MSPYIPESACTQASERCDTESTLQEKKEGGESERGEIWDSIPAHWRQIAQKIASVGQNIAQKGLSKNTQKTY